MQNESHFRLNLSQCKTLFWNSDNEVLNLDQFQQLTILSISLFCISHWCILIFVRHRWSRISILWPRGSVFMLRRGSERVHSAQPTYTYALQCWCMCISCTCTEHIIYLVLELPLARRPQCILNSHSPFPIARSPNIHIEYLILK